MKKILFIIFIFSIAIGSADAQIFKKNASRKAEKGLFGKALGNKKTVKVKEPRAVIKAKKKQEANDKRLKRAYVKSTKASQKRTYDIQTPEVQARMKLNKKETTARETTKKKKAKLVTKKAGEKYN